MTTRDSVSSSSESSRLRLALLRLVEEWEETANQPNVDEYDSGYHDGLDACAARVRALLASPPAPGEKEK